MHLVVGSSYGIFVLATYTGIRYTFLSLRKDKKISQLTTLADFCFSYHHTNADVSYRPLIPSHFAITDIQSLLRRSLQAPALQVVD
jgi:hypothetical protein